MCYNKANNVKGVFSMFCKKCGKQINTDSAFCNYCGAKVEMANNSNSDELIIGACKDCIKKHLKSPLTVNFNKIEIQDKDDYGRIYLYAEVDAQNSFGAIMRNNLRIVLQHVNEDGTYEALNEAIYKVSFINTETVIKKVNKWNKPKN